MNPTIRAAAVAALLALTQFESSAQAADFNLRTYTNNNTQSIHYAGLRKFKEVVDARAAEKINIRLFHSGSLGDDVAAMQAQQRGTLDIATVDTPITTADELLGMFGLPYIFRDRDHVAKVMNGPIGDMVAERLQKKGLRVLGYFEGGFRHITNSVRPIVKPEDLKGIKMRTPSSALRISRALYRAADQGVRRPGEPGDRGDLEQVLRGAEIPFLHRPCLHGELLHDERGRACAPAARAAEDPA